MNPKCAVAPVQAFWINDSPEKWSKMAQNSARTTMNRPKLPFLVADTQLYKRLCPAVRPSVRWSIGPSITIKSKSVKVRISVPAHLSATDGRVSGHVKRDIREGRRYKTLKQISSKQRLLRVNSLCQQKGQNLLVRTNGRSYSMDQNTKTGKWKWDQRVFL